MKFVEQLAAWAGGIPLLLRLVGGLLCQSALLESYQAASPVRYGAAAVAWAHLLSGPATLDRRAPTLEHVFPGVVECDLWSGRGTCANVFQAQHIRTSDVFGV